MKLLRVIGKGQVFFVWYWTLNINGPDLEWPQMIVWSGVVIVSVATFYVTVRAK